MLMELIERLEKEDPKKTLARGFDNPHSYRGYYDQLAFEPCEGPITVGRLLQFARSALGATYQGWKGGDFTMGPYTDCHLAEVGHTGEELGPTLLGYMLRDVAKEPA